MHVFSARRQREREIFVEFGASVVSLEDCRPVRAAPGDPVGRGFLKIKRNRARSKTFVFIKDIV